MKWNPMQWLKKRRKSALCDAMERLKSGTNIHFSNFSLDNMEFILWYVEFLCYFVFGVELMLLGFMPLLLAVTQSQISNICIPAKIADTMLPCRNQQVQSLTAKAQASIHFIAGNMSMTNHFFRRLEDEDEDEDELAPPSDSNTVSDPCNSQVCFLLLLWFHFPSFILILAITLIHRERCLWWQSRGFTSCIYSSLF